MISEEEYEILKGLDNGWRWVARDENNSLWAYLKEPDKKPYGWLSPAVFDKELDKERFQFILWEDEEPHNIAELIEEYEGEEAKVKKALERYKRKLECLKEIDLDMWSRVEPNSKEQAHFNGSMAALDKALGILEELYEPET